MKQQQESFANERLIWNNERIALVREIEDTRNIQTKMFDDYEFRLKQLEQKLNLSNAGGEEAVSSSLHI